MICGSVALIGPDQTPSKKGTPGGNQAGVMQIAADGTLFIAIGNQVERSTNGVYRIQNPMDMYGDQKITQVFVQPNADKQMNGPLLTLLV